jgi:hypothetical protein
VLEKLWAMTKFLWKGKNTSEKCLKNNAQKKISEHKKRPNKQVALTCAHK